MARPISVAFSSPGAALWPNALAGIIQCALNMPLAQAADYWGRKWVIVICATLAFVGSIVISRADNMGAAIAGFFFLAIGQGPTFAAYAVVSEVVPRKHRASVQAFQSVLVGVSGGVALLIIGSIQRSSSLTAFRLYFYVLAAIWGIATLGVL